MRLTPSRPNMVIAKSARHLSAIVFLAGLLSAAVAQEAPKVCDQGSANAATGGKPRECCCAAQSGSAQPGEASKGCCAVASAGPGKKCFADEFQLVLPVPYRRDAGNPLGEWSTRSRSSHIGTGEAKS